MTDTMESLRHEVERLRAMLPPTAHTGVRNGPGEGSWAVFAEKVVAERDAARAQIDEAQRAVARMVRHAEQAERERDEARAQLAALREVLNRT